MEKFFLVLLNVSITAGYFVLALLLLRPLLKKAPGYIRCALWGLVGLRLMLPFSLKSALSLIPSRETISPDMLYAARPIIDSGIGSVDRSLNPVISESFAASPVASVNPLQVWAYAGSLLWLAGFCAMLLYAALSYVCLRRRVAEGVLLEKGVKLCAGIGAPFVLGLFRPCVYLPFGLPEGDMAMVLAHERAHIRRRDHWIKPLGYLLLSVYWFSPLLWLAYALLCRDIEYACDEAVLRDRGADIKKAYSTALLNCGMSRRRISACPLAFGEQSVKPRIKNVLSYKKPALWIMIAALSSCAVLAVCFLTDPIEEQQANIIPAASPEEIEALEKLRDAARAGEDDAREDERLTQVLELKEGNWSLVLPLDGTDTAQYAPPELAEVEGLQVDSRIVQPLQDMLAACRAAGYEPVLFRAYESYSEARAEYEAEEAGSHLSPEQLWAFLRSPMKMDLQSGLSVLLYIPDKKGQEYEAAELEAWYAMLGWLTENGPEYGFVLRFPGEKYAYTGSARNCQFRYVGRDAAQYMQAEGLCLEEFLGLPERYAAEG